jgi:hypothetical protein
MISKLKALWNSLPHYVQAGITLFITMALTTLVKELEQLLSGNEAFTWLLLRHDLAAAVAAGVIAVRTFYMLPNGGKPTVWLNPSNVSQGPMPDQLPSLIAVGDKPTELIVQQPPK